MRLEKIIDLIKSNFPSAFFYTPGVFKANKSFLFQEPDEIITASNVDDIEIALDKIDKYQKKGLVGWGMIPYEIGYLFNNKLKKLTNGSHFHTPLQFCFYHKKKVKVFKSNEITIDSASIQKLTGEYKLKDFEINNAKSQYINNINRIKKYISEGDTYQVNYTVKNNFTFDGDLSSLFLSLIFNQSSRYNAFININDDFVLSFSPELFFSTKAGIISARPMKGTIRRGINTDDDTARKNLLSSGEKDKAENLMIVDLLRNDLGKISRYDSVKVKSLYDIEQYESLFQMTSSINSVLRPEVKFSDIIKNIFPCGSVTGAPKIRTMEIIKELESGQRGIYTGSIGIVKKSSSVFNVAIRTIKINKHSCKGEIGIGSGIVWDSDPEKEYEEVLLKSNFLLKPEGYFEIFESVLIENNRIFLYKYHVQRLETTAKYFQFVFIKRSLDNLLKEVLKKTDKNKKYKLKIILNKWGNLRYEISGIEKGKKFIDIAISGKAVDHQNKYLYFKTTNRSIYDDEFNKYNLKGFGEVIFLNEKGEITEGARTNIFIRKGKAWLTPALNCGLLPGVYRRYLITKNRRCKETILYLSDLLNADEVILTNSVRKKIKVKTIFNNEKEFRSYI